MKEFRILTEKKECGEINFNDGVSDGYEYFGESRITEHIKILLETGEWKLTQTFPFDWSVLNEDTYEVKIIMERIEPIKISETEFFARKAYEYEQSYNSNHSAPLWLDLSGKEQKGWINLNNKALDLFMNETSVDDNTSWARLPEATRYEWRQRVDTED